MGPDRVALYRGMLTCRRLEEAVAGLWHEGRVPGEMHLGIGEEGINAGVLDHLVEGDAVALDHRGTAGMVLRGADPAAVVAECLGRPGGLGGGMGGHMHLYAKERVVVFGEDVEALRMNLHVRFGGRRVRRAPISESAFSAPRSARRWRASGPSPS